MENNSPIEIVTPSLKVEKDDIRAKTHYVTTFEKEGKLVKIWVCGVCGKQFKFQYTLVRHIPTHTGVRNYQCNMCPKAFRQLSTLAQHKVTHLNMRPFVCSYCGKSFNRISTLNSHEKIHYDIKRHLCTICGKGFHQKGNLRNHEYTHTNERPYRCDVCDKGFNQRSNLVCHKNSIHSKKMHNSHTSGIHNTVESKESVEITPVTINLNSQLSLRNHNKVLKNQTAMVYTKTQPSIRAPKPRVNVPSHENTFDACCLLQANCLQSSSIVLTVDGSEFLGSQPSPSTSQQHDTGLIDGSSNSSSYYSKYSSVRFNDTTSDIITDPLDLSPYLTEAQEIQTPLNNDPDSLKDNYKFGAEFRSGYDFIKEVCGSGLLNNVDMEPSSAEAWSSPYSQLNFEDPTYFIDM